MERSEKVENEKINEGKSRVLKFSASEGYEPLQADLNGEELKDMRIDRFDEW